MASIRKTKTASGATAVQVVRYEDRKTVVLKHVGSAKTKQEEDALVESARAWIEAATKQQSLLPRSEPRTLSLATTQYLGVTYAFAHEVLLEVARSCGFDPDKDRLLIDLALMRLIEPASKIRSVELLGRYFDINYSERDIYRVLPALHRRKQALEKTVLNCAVGSLGSELSLVLYDVTTLYFESFKADELRVQGFSKDNKPQQPQIVVGLLTTRDGFPLSYEIFPGNTFEGKTMIPVLEAFCAAHDVSQATVVADAAMLGLKNIKELTSRGLSYIVGARLANAPSTLIDQISEGLSRRDKAALRLQTGHGDLVVSFSKERYRKNRGDMERQVERGKQLVARGEPGRRAKFVTKEGGHYKLDEALIEKTVKLLGIRGYYTNVDEGTLSNQEVISYYHDLWHIEQSFRMAKSDLSFRPIFHRNEDAVKAHILVCFVALAMGKYVEKTTGVSVRTMRDLLWSVTDAQMVDTAGKQSFTFRSPISEEVAEFCRELGLSY